MDERLHRRRGAGLSFLMGGDGDPLLLLHGLPGSSQSWQKVGLKLASRYRVIIPDLLGFGASDAPVDGFYLDEQAAAIRALLHYLQIDRLYVGGHGFGALLAVTLPARYPDLQVRGLIVAAATLWGDTPLPPALRLAKAPALNTLVAWGVAGNPVGLRLLYDVAVHNKEEVRWRDFRRHFPRAGRMMRGIAQRNLADLQHRHAQIEAILPTLACPTLLLWGDDDPISPVQVGERLRAQVPDALLKIYAYTGHFVPEERPVESAEDIVLRFHHDPLPFKGAA